MKIGDLLLLKRYINKKQLKTALRKQSEEAIKYDRSVPLGKVLIELKYVTVDEVAEALNEQPIQVKENKVMSTEIGEGSKFTFDLKFLVTIGAVLVSASATYFSITGQLNEIESSNSPNRMEYEYVVNELNSLKGAGDLKIITYKLDQYDEMFEEIKELVKQLAPLASDLEYIKKELNKLKNKEVDIPEIDLSGIELKLDNLSNSINTFEERLNKIEIKKPGGRF
jgi:ribonuclease HI|tara:strand:+ start:1471 stop:2145 length:675 start_codon:yes stop_codon:yes gene_type:complete